MCVDDGRMPPRKRTLTDRHYERLLGFRTGLRVFLRWSAGQAGAAGLAPVQHQLLLAIRGHRDHESGPTIGDVARYLLIKPHTAGELVARSVQAGLVRKRSDPEDRRIVRLRITAEGERRLARITEATFEELKRLAPRLNKLWEGLDESVR